MPLSGPPSPAPAPAPSAAAGATAPDGRPDRVDEPPWRDRGLFAALPVAALLLDERGVVRAANDAALALFERPLGQLAGQRAAQLMADSAGRLVIQYTLDRARAVGHAVVPALTVLAGRPPRIADAHLRFIPPEGEHGAQFLALFVDRSFEALQAQCLAQAEAARRAQDARNAELAVVAARTRSLVVIADGDGRITWVNDSFVRRTGWTLEEARGRRPGELLQGPATDPETARRMAEALARGAGCSGLEIRNHHRDGTPYWVELDVQAMRDDAGRVERFISVQHDVTARKDDERALRERDAFLQAVFDHDPSGIFVLDGAWRVQLMNRAAAAMAGLERDAPGAGRPIAELLDAGAARALRAALASAGAGPTPEFELRVEREAGAGRLLSVTAAPLPAGGFGDGWLVVARDVTRERELAELARQAVAVEAASQAKTRFLSRMSHELRTPLNAIVGLVQTLRRRGEALEPQTLDARLRVIETASGLLLTMVDEVLQLSRIESGGLRLEPAALPLAPALAEVAELLEPLRARRGCRITVGGDADLRAWADPDRLREVLSNLLSNALKYNRDGGRVTVDLSADGGRVHVAVRDEGPGLEPEQTERLFEPFNRLGAERGDVEGHGMGLVIARGLLQAMDGGIAVHSRPGEGSVFTITLPAAPAQATSAAPRLDAGAAEQALAPPAPAGSGVPGADGDAPGGPRPPPPADPAAGAGEGPGDAPAEPAVLKLLYVEDNDVNAFVMQEVLADFRPDWSLTRAADGGEGIRAARAGGFDAAVLDLSLPDMSGTDVMRAIRADPATAALPCVALSAHAREADRQAAIEAGFDGYFVKPFEVEELLGRLEGLAARRPGG